MPRAKGRPWMIRKAYDCGTCGARKGQLCRNVKTGIPTYQTIHLDRLRQYNDDKTAGKISW